MKTIYISFLCLVLSFNSVAQDTIMPVIKKSWGRVYSSLLKAPEYISGKSRYELQVSTNNLLIAAFNAKEMGVLDSLANLFLHYNSGLDTLKKGQQYYYFISGELDTITIKEDYFCWLDSLDRQMKDKSTIKTAEEGMLNSSQFCYLLSKAYHYFAQIDYSSYTNINRFMQHYPKVLYSHYFRWISNEEFFQTKAWGGIDGRYNHHDFLWLKYKNKLGNQPKYCNAVMDVDMWIISGLTEFLAAHEYNKCNVIIPDNVRNDWQDYLTLGCNLIESRMKTSKALNFEGIEVDCLNFDVAKWQKHPDNDHSKYTGETFPNKLKQQKAERKIGWDIGHSTRFVHVFETLHHNKNITKRDFPSEQQMNQLANQFTYVVFNGDFQKPLFTNYFDGKNGWYRVNYSNRNGFGYAPYDLSLSGINGGYCFWAHHNNDLEKLRTELYKFIKSNDAEVVAHREKYGSYYNNFERTKATNFRSDNTIGALNLIKFLSTFY